MNTEAAGDMDLTGFVATTERLELRPYQHRDFAFFRDMHARADVVRYLPWDVRDDDAARRAFRRHEDMQLREDGQSVTFAGVDRESGEVVGELVLILRSKEHRGGEVGYVIHPDHQRRGYASEGTRALLSIAFDVLGLHRVIARIDPRNVGSAAVLSKVGLRREAHFVRNEFFKGEWTDEVVYAVLADEWSSLGSRYPISWKTSAPARDKASAEVSPPA